MRRANAVVGFFLALSVWPALLTFLEFIGHIANVTWLVQFVAAMTDPKGNAVTRYTDRIVNAIPGWAFLLLWILVAVLWFGPRWKPILRGWQRSFRRTFRPQRLDNSDVLALQRRARSLAEGLLAWAEHREALAPQQDSAVWREENRLQYQQLFADDVADVRQSLESQGLYAEREIEVAFEAAHLPANAKRVESVLLSLAAELKIAATVTTTGNLAPIMISTKLLEPSPLEKYIVSIVDKIKNELTLRQQMFLLEKAFRTIVSMQDDNEDEGDVVLQICNLGLAEAFTALRRHVQFNTLRGDPEAAHLPNVWLGPVGFDTIINTAGCIHRLALKIPDDVPAYSGPWFR